MLRIKLTLGVRAKEVPPEARGRTAGIPNYCLAIRFSKKKQSFRNFIFKEIRKNQQTYTLGDSLR